MLRVLKEAGRTWKDLTRLLLVEANRSDQTRSTHVVAAHGAAIYARC